MPAPLSDRRHWSRAARDWIEWARRPGHDVFWYYRGRLAEFIGPGPGEALDIGCGEGRGSRLLRELGWRVTAADAVEEMVAAAREAGSAHAYAVAPATRLPFVDASFDLVLAYNMLMDVDDLGATLAEARRVLKPRGRLVVSLVHPLRDRGGFRGEAADAPFEIGADWFATTHFAGREERDGLAMNFAGWSRPLGTYVAALADTGFAITGLVEPRPDEGPLPSHLARADRIPIFLWLTARPYA